MRVKARFLGPRIESGTESAPGAAEPMFAIDKVGSRGIVIVFRFGVIVAFDLDDAEESAYVAAERAPKRPCVATRARR